ncbi:hypothetical protein F5X68DRAFT_201788 [Plectosphaerella plurivora]|uniref:Uncharacterized protein n=1 Tax=Plectosphaerella plurivora TaxID=936078 RepID=A0A9P8VHR3_9PEZI|nr:hypothetical protein F5X68DRAFT_201788 [Plectosphaerella plurivora]
MHKPAVQEEPGHPHEKPSTSFDKPGTTPDGKDKDQDHKPKSPADTDDKSTAHKSSTKGGRTLVVYAYAESENSRTNLKFFLKKGLNGAADFVFMLNGKTDADALIPDKPNVRIIRRPNTCYDLGGMGEVLTKDDLWKGYSRFITMNSSIRGPFLPIWSNDCWMERYLERVTDQVKLVGMSVNCDPRLHVQSMIFATDKVGMKLLLDPALATSGSQDDPFGKATDPVGLSSCYESWNSAVHAEIGTTGLITAAGYRYDAMVTALHSEATIEMFCASNPKIKDLWWDNAYFGGNIHPYETIFYKANRNVDTAFVESLTEWHLKIKKDSYDTCGSSH